MTGSHHDPGNFPRESAHRCLSLRRRGRGGVAPRRRRNGTPGGGCRRLLGDGHSRAAGALARLLGRLLRPNVPHPPLPLAAQSHMVRSTGHRDVRRDRQSCVYLPRWHATRDLGSAGRRCRGPLRHRLMPEHRFGMPASSVEAAAGERGPPLHQGPLSLVDAHQLLWGSCPVLGLCAC